MYLRDQLNKGSKVVFAGMCAVLLFACNEQRDELQAKDEQTEEESSVAAEKESFVESVDYTDWKTFERWIVFGKEMTYADGERKCKELGKSIPSKERLVQARENGLKNALGNIWSNDSDEIWTSDVGETEYRRHILIIDEPELKMTDSITGDQVALIACVGN